MSGPVSVHTRRNLSDDLLLAAETCLGGKSHLEITSRDIAEGAGTHASMVNYYFNNKSGLFSELIRTLVVNADSCLRQIEREIEADTGDPTEIIVRGLVRAYPANLPAMSIGIIEIFHQQSEIKRDYIRSGGAKAFLRIERLICKLVAKGGYRSDLDPVSTTWMILSLINGFHVVTQFQRSTGSGNGIPDSENWINAVAAMVRKYAAVDQGPGKHD